MEKNDSLTLAEKKQRWINALLRKLEMRTLEEWDFETMSETIYKDDVLEFYRECQATYGLENVHTQGGMESDLEYFLDEKLDIGEILNIDSLRGQSLLDYMATKGFPMTFQTWPEDTEKEWWDLDKGIKHGKREQ